MNLYWLRYVSYACLAGAAFFYFTLRLNRLKLSRGAQLILYASFILLACATWYAQESIPDHHSPRRLIVGTVTSVSEQNHRGGISDDFQLKLSSGALSPVFSTDLLADNPSDQPIRQGDLLGVLYRTWDDVPVTIDELEGPREGWHYEHNGNDNRYILAVAFAGLVGFVAAFFLSRNRRTAPPRPETRLNLND